MPRSVWPIQGCARPPSPRTDGGAGDGRGLIGLGLWRAAACQGLLGAGGDAPVDISAVVAAAGAAAFAAFLALRATAPLPLLIGLIQAIVVATQAAVAALPVVNFTALFWKGPLGRLPLASYILFWPYQIPLRLYVLLRRLATDEPVYNKVADGFYVGGWPSTAKDVPPGDVAVIDCTCELSRTSSLMDREYLCLPVWDTRAPLPEQIQKGVQWVLDRRVAKRDVLVHCAFGHGRGVTVLCAILVAAKLAASTNDALRSICKVRPRAHLNRAQTASLAQWAGRQLQPSQSKTEGSTPESLASCNEASSKAGAGVGSDHCRGLCWELRTSAGLLGGLERGLAPRG
eukprot:SM000036S13324  [mRNA]  locus=s36:613379:615629:+ [translate_table: standard]